MIKKLQNSGFWDTNYKSFNASTQEAKDWLEKNDFIILSGNSQTKGLTKVTSVIINFYNEAINWNNDYSSNKYRNSDESTIITPMYRELFLKSDYEAKLADAVRFQELWKKIKLTTERMIEEGCTDQDLISFLLTHSDHYSVQKSEQLFFHSKLMDIESFRFNKLVNEDGQIFPKRLRNKSAWNNF
jgi:hypothetical protein